MYNYDFDNEKIIKEFTNTKIDINGDRKVLDIILTDKNILIFRESTQDNVLKAAIFIHQIPKYDLLYSFTKNVKMTNAPTMDDTTIHGEDEITLYNINLKEEIK